MARFLLYSHDSYGLGHLRRSTAIARGLVAADPTAQVLLVTGSPMAHSFRLPPRTQAVGLPGVTKDKAGRYVPRQGDLPLAEVLALRSELIDASIRSFGPDLILVDHSPLGLGGELAEVLRRARERRPERPIVLGLRDIHDDPGSVRAAWAREGIYQALEELYDQVLVYGQESVFSPVREYGLSEAVAARTRYTGYVHDRAAVGRTSPRPAGAPPTVLLTVGGGGDGDTLVRTYLEGLTARRGRCAWRSVVITGPLMEAAEREATRRAAAELPDVEVLEFTPRIQDYQAAADVVISMTGYNTTVELLGMGKRIVTVPRVFPREEQLVRAERLAELGLLTCLRPDACDPDSLLRTVGESLSAPPPPVAGRLDLGGVAATVEALAELTAAARATAPLAA